LESISLYDLVSNSRTWHFSEATFAKSDLGSAYDVSLKPKNSFESIYFEYLKLS